MQISEGQASDSFTAEWNPQFLKAGWMSECSVVVLCNYSTKKRKDYSNIVNPQAI